MNEEEQWNAHPNLPDQPNVNGWHPTNHPFLYNLESKVLTFNGHNAAFLNGNYLQVKTYKTGGVRINDPLGQPIVPAGSDCRLDLKFIKF